MKLFILILGLMICSAPSASAGLDDTMKDKWGATGKTHGVYSLMSDVGVAGLTIAPFIIAMQGEQKGKHVGAVAAAFGLNFIVTDIVKTISWRERPNKVDRESFYSGHTATAFTGASLVCLQSTKYMCAGSMALAVLVGYWRIAGNYHWFTDVAVGMGVGLVNGFLTPTLVINF